MLLNMSSIRKSFGATQALDGVDLTINEGEVHALIGENGAGKSTLMKIISGAIKPDSGMMHFNGQPYQPIDPRWARRSGVAMIYQELSLAPHLTVFENIFLGNEITKGPFVNRSQMIERSKSALARVGRPDLNPNVRVDRLSIADRQLVEIARSVALGCKLLVLDEPSSSITSHDVDNLFKLIDSLRGQGIGIIYISHFLEEIMRISDRYTVLRDGRSVASGDTSEATTQAIVKQMVGRQVDELYPRSNRVAGEVILRVDNLIGRRLPKDASLELRRGEVLGIAGLIGSGRTELIRSIFALDEVASGVVRVAQMQPKTPLQMWKHGVGLVSEDRKNEGLALNLSIAKNLTLSKLEGLGPSGFVLPSNEVAASKPWLDRLSIRCRNASQNVGELSGGNQQKVALARLLHADVDVLLLDEPTRGIDVGSKAHIYQLIDQLVSTPNRDGKCKAVIVVSSYLPELLGMCDRIQVMQRGTLNSAKAISNRNEHEIMLEATGIGGE
jgi:ribose transport system ATP-binding protein